MEECSLLMPPFSRCMALAQRLETPSKLELHWLPLFHMPQVKLGAVPPLETYEIPLTTPSGSVACP